MARRGLALVPSVLLAVVLCGCSTSPKKSVEVARAAEPAESEVSTATLVGTWRGEFHQHSHTIYRSYPMVLTIDHVSPTGELTGSLCWPWTRTLTAIGANVVEDMLYINE